MGNLLRRRSASTGVAPTSLEFGQIAINYADGLIFWKDATGTIRSTTLYPAALDSPEFLGNPRRADALSGSDDSNSLTTSAWVRTAIAALAGAVSQAWGTISGTPTTLAGYGITDAIPSSEKGAANGVATLDADSKIPEAQLPALAITDVFEAASQAAMLALTAERGDVCVRSDLNKSYVLSASPASTLANWKELRTPTDAVLTVAGRAGAVTLTASDLTDGTAVGRAIFTAANVAAQQAAMSVVPGTHVQPYDADLTSWAGIAPSSKQDHSTNLDGWSALATSAKQDALGFTPARNDYIPERAADHNGLTSTNGLARVIFPDGATYVGGSSVTGAIKIALPTAAYAYNSMLRMRVEIYDHAADESITLLIAGYLTAAHAWSSETVTILASKSDRDFSVRFGNDGASGCIWIGELASTWGYPRVHVAEVQASYNSDGAPTSRWETGWAVTVETAFDTVEDTISSNLPVAQSVPTASQAEAEAGTAQNVWMDPLRTAQAIAALGGGGMTWSTPVATTSGSAVDFTSIPTGVTHVQLLFLGVSNTSGDPIFLQLGDSGGFETSGYNSAYGLLYSSNSVAGTSTTGFYVAHGVAANTVTATVDLYLADPSAHTWLCSITGRYSNSYMLWAAGDKDITTALTQIRVSIQSGTFDAGKIAIGWE